MKVNNILCTKLGIVFTEKKNKSEGISTKHVWFYSKVFRVGTGLFLNEKCIQQLLQDGYELLYTKKPVKTYLVFEGDHGGMSQGTLDGPSCRDLMAGT